MRKRFVAACVLGVGFALVGRTILHGASGMSARAQVSAPAPVLLFSLLTSSEDNATLEIVSQGDGGGIRTRYVYAPLPTPRVTVTPYHNEAEISADKKSYRRTEVAEPPGTVTLTPEQVTRFDNLLHFYRKRLTSRCTIRDVVHFTVSRTGKEQASEHFQDDSCRRFALEDADARDLRTLKIVEAPTLSLIQLKRIAQEAAQQKLPLPYQDVPRAETDGYGLAQRVRADADEKQRTERMMRNMAGHSQLSQHFTIKSAMLGHINMLPYSLHPVLQARTPRTVDASWWFDPVTSNRPKYDWNQYLKLQSEIERLTTRHPWLAAWKKMRKGRSIESQIFGLTPDTEVQPQYYVFPAWRHAGLKGKPWCELLLRRTDNTWITIYLGREDSRALVLSAHSPKTDASTAPLDLLRQSKQNSDPVMADIAVSYHPTQSVPDYVLVLPNGTLKRNTRIDNKTPNWFAKETN